MEAPEGPPRFKCPSDFSASPFCPGPPFSPETLQEPSKELWLIRAPTSFSPESLNGHSVPLPGFQTLKASQPDGTEKIFHFQTTLEHLGGAHLLVPSGDGVHLTCSPAFSSSLRICERYGDPSDNQPLFPVVARPALQIPEGLKQRFLPFGSCPKRAPLPGVLEEPPRKKKKKTKKHRLGKEDAEEQLALLGRPLGEATGAGEAEEDGAALLANGSQPSSAAAVVQDRRVEAPGPRRKKKKKKRKDEKLKEMGGEAEAGHQHAEEGGAAMWAVGSLPEAQPNSAALAQDTLHSGETEDPGPRNKKKKRKETGELKDETEAAHLHEENGTTPWAIGSQPSSEPIARDGLLSGETEDPSPRSKKKKKKKRKEDRELKEGTGEEAEATHLHEENGTTPWAIGSQPCSESVAQDGLLSGEAEDPGPRSKKKKKKKRKEDREMKDEMGEEAEAAHPHEENGTTPWAVGSQPCSESVAQDGLLSGDAEDPGPRSKKKKRKEDRKVKDKMGEEAGGLLDFSSCLGEISEPQPGEDSLPGMEVTQRKHKGKRKEKAALAEPASNTEEASRVLWDFSGLGATPEGGLVLAQEESGVGSSSHKAKKKRKKEKEEPQGGAQELGGWPAPPEVEIRGQLGIPLGGGGGQEAEPGMEEPRQRPKKKKHPRQEAVEQGPAELTQERQDS